MNISKLLPPLEEKITVTLPIDTISDVGKEEFSKWAEETGHPRMPDWWDWTWTTKSGPYVGTFPKRYSNYIYKMYGTKISPKELSEVGNKVAAHTNRSSEFILDFTDIFDWRSGDFGDRGSCFWEGSKKGARTAIYQAGGLAVRFWKRYEPFTRAECAECEYLRENTSNRLGFAPLCNKCYRDKSYNKTIRILSKRYKGMYGYARAWFLPHLQNRQDIGLVFNGYSANGSHTEIQTLGSARILSQLLGLSYKKIGLTNFDDENRLVYLNDEKGYLLGESSTIRDISETGMRMQLRCEECNVSMYDSKYRFISTKKTFCLSCADRIVVGCDVCGKWTVRRETRRLDNSMLCTSCFALRTKVCIVCKMVFSSNSLRRVRCDSCIRSGKTLRTPRRPVDVYNPQTLQA